MPPTPPSRTARALLWGAIALFVAVRIAAARASDLWFDELFSVGLASADWPGLLHGAAVDQTNPPLFYLLLKAWIGIVPPTPGWLRTLPALLGIAATWPLIRFFRRAGLGPDGTPLALAAVAVLVSVALPIAEVRAYPLLFLLSIASGALALRLAAREDAPPARRDVIDLTAVNIALAYSHYYGWFTIIAGGTAIVIFRPDLRRVALISLGATALAFAPWVAAVLGAARTAHAVAPTLGWIARPTALDLVRTPLILLGGSSLVATVIVGIAIGLPVLVEAWRTTRVRDPVGTTLTLLASVPLAGAFTASWVLPHAIWGERYLIIVVPALLALAFRWVARAGGTLARAALAAVAIGAGLLGWRNVSAAKIPWRDVAARLTAGPGASPAPVYTFEGFTALPLAYYARLDATGAEVTPLPAFDAIRRPGWLVVRDEAWPGAAQWHTPAAALAAGGWMVSDSFVVEAPRQRIAAYRFVGGTPAR